MQPTLRRTLWPPRYAVASVGPVIALVLSLVLSVGAGSAQAVPTGPVGTSREAQTARVAAAPSGDGAARRGPHRRHRHQRPPAPPPVPGQPPGAFVVPPGAFFSYPQGSARDQRAIRSRVLRTINSVWGAPKDARGLPVPGGGTVRMTTWSFDDMDVARALLAARRRGVSVQIVAAKSANKQSASWHLLRRRLGGALLVGGDPATAELSSFARQCAGSCRGPGGAAHSKYFLFDDVGPAHVRDVVVNTSMNLTTFAFTHQWNQAQVLWSPPAYADLAAVFAQSRVGLPVPNAYVAVPHPPVYDYVFPEIGATDATDPAVQVLAPVSCVGAAVTPQTPNGRTKIRVIQYAIYGQRGVWIAKRLRQLWDAGCNMRLIVSVISRPVLQILSSRRGRGPVPVRQSVISDWSGAYTTYNHSKWLTVNGFWNGDPAAGLAFSGSANWGDLALTSDEQMQALVGPAFTLPFLAAFARTWRQRTSRTPRPTSAVTGGRLLPGAGEPRFGHGVLRLASED